MKEQTFLYSKKVECPVCSQKYTTKKILTKFIRIHKHDTDFCSYYASSKHNPLLYYVQVCPSCGYSSSEEFSSFFPPGTLSDIKNKVSLNWRGTDYCIERSLAHAINTYKLAIYCAGLKKEKHIAQAGLFLRLAWLYRTEEVNPEEEKRFMRLAVHEYIQSYMTGDYTATHLSEVKLLYIIGDLSRRLEQKEQATRYFSRVIQMQKDTIEKRIVEMAKDRWSEMRTV